jgi:hypothetical protein
MTTSRATVLTLLVSSSACLFGLSGAVRAGAPDADQVELFAAVEAQQIELKLVPKDARQATVLIKNKTDRPLSIKMPAAFAGMPVLAQNVGGAGGNRGGGGGGGSNTSSNQTMGGGFGGGMMGGGMMGGFFDVGPDRVGKVKVGTVCLEHGKDDPNPRVAYELKPITEFSDKAELAEVCKMLSSGDLDQATAQAAAWHLSDGLTFPQLAQKVRVRHLNGQVEMYFNAQQLQHALQAVQLAHHRAAQDRTDPEIQSPGEHADAEAQSDSLSLK